MALEIRRARPEDRQTVMEICAHTWEGGDYIPEVWDEWLADEQGPLLVGVLDGEVVAVEKIRWTAPQEVWLEGLRVHPERRGKGIGTALFHHALEWARAHGARMARLATGADNLPVHRMVEAVAFQRVLSSPFCVAESLPSGEEPERLSPDMAAEVWDALQRWGGLAECHGLYGRDWAWQRLTPEQLAEDLQRGEVWGVRDRRGALQAMAIVQETGEPEAGIVVVFWDGDVEGLARLARALRVLAGHFTPPLVGIMPRQDPGLLKILETAGYKVGWDETFWVFEGPL